MCIRDRPIAELVNPKRKDIADSFKNEFETMTNDAVTLTDLEEAREKLITTIKGKLTAADKEFLLSVKNQAIQWDNFYYPHAQHLPAVKWKLHNIQQMTEKARQAAATTLTTVLNT